MRARQGPEKRETPALLLRLFGDGNVLCLRELLLLLSAQSRDAAPLSEGLVLPHDHADYAQVGAVMHGKTSFLLCCLLEAEVYNTWLHTPPGVAIRAICLLPSTSNESVRLPCDTAGPARDDMVRAAAWRAAAAGRLLAVSSLQPGPGKPLLAH
jgi:hypothetical protein